MTLSGIHYVVPINFQFDEILNNIKTAKENIDQLQISTFNDEESKNLGHMGKYAQERLKYIKSLFSKLQTMAEDFINNRITPINKRTKRGLINAIGYASQFLFGTATDRDIRLIHKHINNQAEYQRLTRTQVNLHSQILNHTIADLASLHNITKTTANAINILKDAMNNQSNVNDYLKTINIQQNIMSELELNLHNVRFDFTTLTLGIDEFLLGYASTNLIQYLVHC